MVEVHANEDTSRRSSIGGTGFWHSKWTLNKPYTRLGYEGSSLALKRVDSLTLSKANHCAIVFSSSSSIQAEWAFRKARYHAMSRGTGPDPEATLDQAGGATDEAKAVLQSTPNHHVSQLQGRVPVPLTNDEGPADICILMTITPG